MSLKNLALRPFRKTGMKVRPPAILRNASLVICRSETFSNSRPIIKLFGYLHRTGPSIPVIRYSSCVGVKAASVYRPKYLLRSGLLHHQWFSFQPYERAVDSYLLGTEIMNVLVEYIQQDIGLCIGVISVCNLIEKLGMALGNIRIIRCLRSTSSRLMKPKSANDFR